MRLEADETLGDRASLVPWIASSLSKGKYSEAPEPCGHSLGSSYLSAPDSLRATSQPLGDLDTQVSPCWCPGRIQQAGLLLERVYNAFQ